jgi:Na+/proline symporter
MSALDWIVLGSTLLFIVLFGIWKSRGQKKVEGYLLGDQSLPWYHVMFSVMATQASAITFLSAPGQGYEDGMRFVQYYFGLPLAMIVVSTTFLPVFHKLKVFTAYEYLEQRFDVRIRSLTAFLFLVQRGLAAGITIYAPSLVLSSILNWEIHLTCIFMGGLVIIYTVYGGTKAVSYTQIHQMTIILIGMFIAGYMVVSLLPEDISFNDALTLAGAHERMNIITTEYNITDKYNIWSGLIGGFFLSLSYFGTDQSQVGRYLSGKSISQSRTGLLFNGMLKIPMQFFILLIGVLLFSFYQFNYRPLNFNPVDVEMVKNSSYNTTYHRLESEYNDYNELRIAENYAFLDAHRSSDKIQEEIHLKNIRNTEEIMENMRDSARSIIHIVNPLSEGKDTNYIFLSFVITYLPAGLIGLLIAVIFSASWSSTASELNALASTSLIDFYKRFGKKSKSERHYLNASKLLTVVWGLLAMLVALFVGEQGSLIEAVNILGSLFYGTILGIFLTAFLLKKVNGTSVLIGAILVQVFTFFNHSFGWTGFLWFNLLGAAGVMIISYTVNALRNVILQKNRISE